MTRPFGYAVVLLSLLALGTPAHATAMGPTCEDIMLTPEQRAAKADIVFDGNVTQTTCTCMPLATGNNDFGGHVECTDVIAVITPLKGSVGPEVTIKNIVVIDPDPKADLSKSECKGKVEDRHDKLLGSTRTYYLKQSGEFFDPVSPNACD